MCIHNICLMIKWSNYMENVMPANFIIFLEVLLSDKFILLNESEYTINGTYVKDNNTGNMVPDSFMPLNVSLIDTLQQDDRLMVVVNGMYKLYKVGA